MIRLTPQIGLNNGPNFGICNLNSLLILKLSVDINIGVLQQFINQKEVVLPNSHVESSSLNCNEIDVKRLLPDQNIDNLHIVMGNSQHEWRVSRLVCEVQVDLF